MTQKIDHLALQLTKIFGDGEPRGPCACIGFDCGNIGCEIWWRHFLSLSDVCIHRMVEAYKVARDDIGIKTVDGCKNLSLLGRSLANNWASRPEMIYGHTANVRSPEWWADWLLRLEKSELNRMVKMYLALSF